MKKTDYTHIRVSKELHIVLKREAGKSKMSISNYIAMLLARNQKIEVKGVSESNESNVNIIDDAQRSTLTT